MVSRSVEFWPESCSFRWRGMAASGVGNVKQKGIVRIHAIIHHIRHTEQFRIFALKKIWTKCPSQLRIMCFYVHLVDHAYLWRPTRPGQCIINTYKQRTIAREMILRTAKPRFHSLAHAHTQQSFEWSGRTEKNGLHMRCFFEISLMWHCSGMADFKHNGKP